MVYEKTFMENICALDCGRGGSRGAFRLSHPGWCGGLQSIIFFNLQNFGFAFLWLVVLWVLILRMIFTFRKTDSLAAWLQVPYFLWVTFAAYLNLGVWMLNR